MVGKGDNMAKSSFSKVRCKICGKMVSTGGAAFTSHARMHVKNKEAIEFRTSKGLKFLPEAEYRSHLDKHPYALLGEDPLPGQPKGIWEIPDIACNMPAVDPASYFITSGEADINTILVIWDRRIKNEQIIQAHKRELHIKKKSEKSK
jgi:hypothetical protein